MRQLAPLDPSIAVSVVIVSWNTVDVLRGCLASIRDETRSCHQVVVVDNASTDGTQEMVASEFPEVELVCNTDNRGFAAANNQGIERSVGAHVLLLNPDTVILGGAIDRCLEWLARHPEVGCMGCQVFEDEATVQRTCFSDMTPFNMMLVEFKLLEALPSIFGKAEYRMWDRMTEREVDVVSGMFMLVPRAVVEKVGMLDEAFFVFAEEADWCRRIRAAGWRCYFSPVAKILHLDGGSKSTAQIRPRMHVQLQKSKLIYMNKYYGKLGEFVARLTMIASMTARYLLFLPIGAVTKKDDHVAHAALSRASLRFLTGGGEPK